ncbi:DUF4397 domain-containing protein [Neobacillus pocheonensis]|uniref:DUF4397 domain-containing protein n=1 Tax=Neobacillus pocheonensis TaxID=363869 RepID=UPI003D277D17
MSEMRSQSDYLQRALLYDMLAQFYKYTYPNLHIHYYGKHLKYMKKAMYMIRSTQQEDAKVRFVHTSYDTPNVDIYINGQRTFRELPFKNISTEHTLKAGKYHIDIYQAGNSVDSILNKKITIEPGKSYTLAVIDSVQKLRLLQFENQPEVPANEAKVRFIHLSPDSETFDVAVKDRDVIFPNVSYKQATEYLGLTPMTVDLEVRETGSRTVLLPMPKMQFKANESYTIIFVGLTKDNSEFQFISIKD